MHSVLNVSLVQMNSLLMEEEAKPSIPEYQSAAPQPYGFNGRYQAPHRPPDYPQPSFQPAPSSYQPAPPQFNYLPPIQQQQQVCCLATHTCTAGALADANEFVTSIHSVSLLVLIVCVCVSVFVFLYTVCFMRIVYYDTVTMQNTNVVIVGQKTAPSPVATMILREDDHYLTISVIMLILSACCGIIFLVCTVPAVVFAMSVRHYALLHVCCG